MRWPHWSFEHVGEEIWWYQYGACAGPKDVDLEPEGVLLSCSYDGACFHSRQLNSEVGYSADVKICVCVWVTGVLFDRVEELRQFLEDRPEHCIAIVSHSGVLEALTGYQFGNGELKTCKLSDLIVKVPAS